ncbi:hypothetical protein [Rhizobium hainanense]|uniref:Uncharacterized protein n=1 Tax=Rhizobium hainanense TaxID=52131 RepID=A0A1C3VYT7_9HYPH|nr:hypothetical protein [Rhizobium hainanense]SCB32857.1 hypothetical protein GA0061100_109132 [Rhizobium hainanense]
MFKQTLSIARRNMAFYATFILCSVGASIFDEYSGGSASAGATFILMSILSMNVQNSVLRDQNFTAAAKGRKLPFAGYMFRSVALTLGGFMIMLPILVILLKLNDLGKAYVGLWATLAFLVTLTIVFSLFGTWLPARLHGTNASIGDALRRGLKRFPSTASLIFLGLAVPLVAGVIVGILASSVRGTDLIVNGQLNIPVVVASLVSNALQMIGWTYVSVLLARRYMVAEHIEPPPSTELLTALT